MTQSEKLRLCAEALGLPQFVDFAEAPFPDAQAFELLAWLHEQPEVELSIGGGRSVAYIDGGITVSGQDLKQFLIDCVAAVMAARRGKDVSI